MDRKRLAAKRLSASRNANGKQAAQRKKVSRRMAKSPTSGGRRASVARLAIAKNQKA